MTIYFIQCGDDGPIKIGHTKGFPAARVKSIQIACPYKIRLIKSIHGGTEYEHKIQRDLADYKSHGEWFYPHPYVLKSIDEYQDAKEGDKYFDELYLSVSGYDSLRSKFDIDKLIAMDLGLEYKDFIAIKKRQKPLPKNLYDKVEKIIGHDKFEKYVNPYK